MRALIALTGLSALAACQPAEPERLEWPKPLARGEPSGSPTHASMTRASTSPPVVTETMPDVSIKLDLTQLDPDMTPFLRWPLLVSEHLAFEPHFDIVNALAEPGMEWTRLCALGAHKRVMPPRLADQGRYLAGWCAALDHDFGHAIELLAPLRSSVVSGMSDAVRTDLAILLCQTGTANDARQLATKYALTRDLAVLDRLTAMYDELHQEADALEINNLAIANDNYAVRGDSCHRFARRVALVPDGFRNRPHVLHDPATQDDAAHVFPIKMQTDPTCRRLEAQAACWLDNEHCNSWWKENGATVADVEFSQAVKRWPSSSNNPHEWIRVAETVLDLIPDPRAYDLVLRSLRNAIKTTPCSDVDTRRRIRVLADSANRATDDIPAATRAAFLPFQETEKLCWPD